MTQKSTIHPVWLGAILLACLGANGCPTQVGCGVSGSMPGGPGGFGAQTWNCQVGMQFAKGASIATPQQARADLLAKKDGAAIQVAALKEKSSQGGDQAFGFGGKDPKGSDSNVAQASQELQRAVGVVEKLDTQIASVDTLQPPSGATVLSDGTWTLRDGQAFFETQAPYDSTKKFVIPYVVRSELGEVLTMGYLSVESVRVAPGP
ncbi:MAG: hypothetical protein ABL965_14965 [Nitrospira sp.]|nr:MAG: hypothetical protein E8D44_07560 [Nitrospira sp.]